MSFRAEARDDSIGFVKRCGRAMHGVVPHARQIPCYARDDALARVTFQP